MKQIDEHIHNYKMIGVWDGIPQYFECAICTDQVDEQQASDYYDWIQNEALENQITGV